MRRHVSRWIWGIIRAKVVSCDRLLLLSVLLALPVPGTVSTALAGEQLATQV